MTIHYFNPDNDLALANGGAHYTATPRAELLRRDLQLLPCWLAASGDAVLCDDTSLQAWVDAQGLSVTLIDRRALPDLSVGAVLRPWGWSAAMRWRLARWGVDERILPSHEQMAVWRQLAHRRISIAIHSRVGELLGRDLCPPPVELTLLDEVMAFARAHPGGYVKEPWSGSGRGILRALPPVGRDFVQRAEGALRRQGSVLCEPAYDCMLDFAVEMACRGGTVEMTGYSVFRSDFHSQYSAGIVASRRVLRRMIENMYPDFSMVESAVVQSVSELVAPHYDGVLGVDMLLYRRTDGIVGINPCVELNLRTTMGHVTAALADRHVMQGRFIIKPVPSLQPGDKALTPIVEGSTLVACLSGNNG